MGSTMFFNSKCGSDGFKKVVSFKHVKDNYVVCNSQGIEWLPEGIRDKADIFNELKRVLKTYRFQAQTILPWLKAMLDYFDPDYEPLPTDDFKTDYADVYRDIQNTGLWPVTTHILDLLFLNDQYTQRISIVVPFPQEKQELHCKGVLTQFKGCFLLSLLYHCDSYLQGKEAEEVYSKSLFILSLELGTRYSDQSRLAESVGAYFKNRFSTD